MTFAEAHLQTAVHGVASGTGICDIPGVDLNPACLGKDAVGGLVSGIAGSALQELSQAVVGAVTEILAAVVGFLSTPIEPNVRETWLATSYTSMLAASATFAALFFVFGIARAILRASVGELGRVVGFTVLAFAGSGIALTLSQAFIVLVDVATGQLTQGMPSEMAGTFSRLSKPLVTLAAAGGGQSLIASVLGTFLGLAALAVYLELFVRNVMIHVVVYFLPLMLIGTIWEPTRRWGRRGIEFLAVLILSKFVLFAVIALGWSAVASFDDTALSTSWASVLTGFVLVAVAAWLPWLLFKLLPFMEMHVQAAMNRHDARAGVTAPMTSATAPMRTLEGGLRRAAGVAAMVHGGPLAAGAALSGGGGGGAGSFFAGGAGRGIGGANPSALTASSGGQGGGASRALSPPSTSTSGSAASQTPSLDWRGGDKS